MNKKSYVTFTMELEQEDVLDIKCGDEFFVTKIVGELRDRHIFLRKVSKINSVEVNVDV